jgi:hypothetical protein
MGFEKINFNGVIVFPFARYQMQLLSTRGALRSEGLRKVHPIRPTPDG